MESTFLKTKAKVKSLKSFSSYRDSDQSMQVVNGFVSLSDKTYAPKELLNILKASGGRPSKEWIEAVTTYLKSKGVKDIQLPMRRNNIYKKMATILGYPTDQLHLYPDPDVAKLQPSKRKSRKELLIAEAEGLKEVDETYQEQKESAELWQTIYDSKKKKLDTEETDYTPGYDNKPFTPPRRHFTDSELESVPPSVKKGYYSKGYAGPISYDVGKTARKLKLETIVYGDE